MFYSSELNLADVLFRPRSIALVGASDRRDSPAGRPLALLREASYEGRVYVVNPKFSVVQGEQTWDDLSDLPETPDHVYLLGSSTTVLAAVQACVALEVPVVTILASGFSESGPQGVALENEIRAALLGSRTRLLGPSSLGVVNFQNGCRLSANAACAGEFPVGQQLVVSHSGSIIGALVTRARSRGAGFAGLVSVGSEIDLTMADICASTLSEPSITGYILFLEHLRDADRLRRFAAEARSQGKSVVAYKLGRTAEAAKLSVSHTGAMVGEDQFAATFLRESGIARIHHIDALPEAVTLARVLGDIPQQRTVSLAVVGTTGGGSAMLVDEMALRGVHVSRLSASSVQDLSQSGIRYGDGSVLDLTLAGTKAEVMSRALDVVAGSGDFDLVLVVLGSSAHSRPQATVAPVIEAFQKASCAIAVLVMPHAPEALALLLAAGVPAFNAPEVCADAIQAVFKARYRDRPENPLAIPARRRPEELLDAIGIARPPEVLASWDTEEPLALPFDYPVVMKVYGEGLLHKTDVGGVVLGIATPYEAAQVLAQWKASEVFDGKEVRIQIQPMVRGVVAEVLVGFLRDREVGPVVTVAMGGILAELSEQRVLRLAPVSVAEAREMISELAPLKVLDGYRGKPRGDREALAEAIAALSRLAACREVVEAEINPLMVLAEGKGVAAVDVLVQGK